MFDRLIWIFIRRHFLALTHQGFKASFRSYADKKCSFTLYNRLYGTSIIHNSKLGRFTYVAGAKISNTSIGSFCSIGPDAIIGELGRHPTNWISTHPAFYSTLNQAGCTFSDADYFLELSPVTIGSDVWIGARAVILDGVSIGHGSIIATGAIVTKDVAPYSIVGGVPAKLIRYRHNEETIKELLHIKWWDWPEDKLREMAADFRSNSLLNLLLSEQKLL